MLATAAEPTQPREAHFWPENAGSLPQPLGSPQRRPGGKPIQFPQRVLLLLVLLGTTFAAAAAAQTATISPSDRAQLEGSTFTHLPLGRHDARMQTLHLDLPGGTVLTGHAYRREAAGVYGGVAGFASDLEVSISMSPRTPATATILF